MTIKYHFFGKNCVIDRALSDRKNLLQNLDEQGFRSNYVLLLNQIHGKEVVVIDSPEKIYGEQNLPKADAVVTNLKNITIGVVTADCSPILLFDGEVNVIGVAHAGWRGAKLGVINSVIQAMKNLGAKDIKAIIGPMIQQKSYEISQEFFDDFLREDSDNKKFFLGSSKVGHYLFDLPRYVEKKLRVAGIEKIENPGIDTYKNEESFFSFRRSAHLKEPDCGRNVAVIVIS